VLNAVAKAVPSLVGGSADLAPSNNTHLKDLGDFSRTTPAGRNFHFGVREHGMGAVVNGMAYHGGLRPFCATFMVFSDYMRGSVRVAAIAKLPVIYVFTHDSIFVGEDGPTHEPVEHLAALRVIPNVQVLRPADAEETEAAWRMALERTDGPTALALTRQNLAVFSKHDAGWRQTIRRGAYVARDCAGTPETVIVATYDFRNQSQVEDVRAVAAESLGGIGLSWRVRAAGNLTSIRIYRSVEYDTGYVMIAEIPPEETAYVDAGADEMQRYFYYLETTGLLDEVSPKSIRVFGTMQSSREPDPPVGLEAEALENGVRLSWWSFPDGHTAGYYVYRGEGRGRELSQISPLLPVGESLTSYVDTSAFLTGTHQYAYAVRAESRSYVLGPFSDTVLIRPGIPTVPHAPFGLEARVIDGFVQLYWEDMENVEPDAQGFFVLRRELPLDGVPAEFERINDALLPPQQNNYVDTTVRQGMSYEYVVQTQDFVGGLSPLSPSKRVELRLPDPIAPAGLRAGRRGETMSVSWDETVQPNLVAYRLYRYEREKEPVLVAEVRPDVLEVEDKGLNPGELYFYYLTSIGSEGRESERSEEVGIRF